jgi:hypothetical protein
MSGAGFFKNGFKQGFLMGLHKRLKKGGCFLLMLWVMGY